MVPPTVTWRQSRRDQSPPDRCRCQRRVTAPRLGEPPKRAGVRQVRWRRYDAASPRYPSSHCRRNIVSDMRNAVVGVAAAAVFGLAAACGSAGTGGTSPSNTPAAAPNTTSPPARSVAASGSGTASPNPELICRQVLGTAALLDWAPGSVAQFRAYQYGGPQPTIPLADAFPGVPKSARGAWCATPAGGQATHWWAVVVGYPAASVMTIHGPGEGIGHGPVSGPPQVP